MKISYKTKSIITISAISLAAMLSAPSRGLAEEVSAPQLVLSATGYEVPENRVANDITVITKEDIAHLPVHDISEALNYTTGVAIDRNAGPGSLTVASIQGSDPRHVKILLDGMPLELMIDQSLDLSMLPVENVDRIEVLKGSASSVWGSSLGGVINIVTRKPTEELSGDAGFLAGEGNTRKYNAAISGTAAGTGYFLSASRLETSTLIKNQDTDTQVNNIYLKLTRELTKGLNIAVSGGSNSNSRQFIYPYIPNVIDNPFIAANRNADVFGTVNIDYAPAPTLNLSLSGFKRQFNYEQELTLTGDTAPFFTQKDREDSYGGSLKSVWKHSDNGILAAGLDASNWGYDDTAQSQKYYTDRRAVYLNESYMLGNLSMTAGVRYDDDSVYGSETSPSAGLAYNIEAASTILRLNAARGFTPPPLGNRYQAGPGETPNSNLRAERAWTYQAGVETRYIPGLFGKVTLYRADITDAVFAVRQDTAPFNFINYQNIKNFRRQGVEVQATTDEYMGVSLSYGYAFNDVRDLDLDEVVKNKARETHDIGLSYRGPFETRTTVQGHYINWNAKDVMNAKDKTFVWDARFSKYLVHWKKSVGEVFVSVHNITEEKQYLDEIFPNPGRWVEAGVGISF